LNEVAQMLSEAGISVIDPAPQLAARIQSEKHFRAFLQATPPAMRKKAYEALAPHLLFKPIPYSMMKLGRKKTIQ